MCRNIIHSILRKVVLYNQDKEQSRSERNKDDSERELKGRVLSVKVLRPVCTDFKVSKTSLRSCLPF